jgi:hypothetical protein
MGNKQVDRAIGFLAELHAMHGLYKYCGTRCLDCEQIDTGAVVLNPAIADDSEQESLAPGG